MIVGDHLKLVARVVDEQSRGEAEGADDFDIFSHFAIEALGDLREITVAPEFVIDRMFFRIVGPDYRKGAKEQRGQSEQAESSDASTADAARPAVPGADQRPAGKYEARQQE